MIKETIEYINDLGYYKTLEITLQRNGLYFMAILYRGKVVNCERNCTEKRVQDLQKKILTKKYICKIITY